MQCSFCDFAVRPGVGVTTADRLLAQHCSDSHRQIMRALSSTVQDDLNLLLQFGDLIDRFQEESQKRLVAVQLMTDLSEVLRKRVTEAKITLCPCPSVVMNEIDESPSPSNGI